MQWELIACLVVKNPNNKGTSNASSTPSPKIDSMGSQAFQMIYLFVLKTPYVTIRLLLFIQILLDNGVEVGSPCQSSISCLLADSKLMLGNIDIFIHFVTLAYNITNAYIESVIYKFLSSPIS
jgi:hypothetical protein